MERGKMEGEDQGIEYFDCQRNSKFSNSHHQRGEKGSLKTKAGEPSTSSGCCPWPFCLSLTVSLVIRTKSMHAGMLL